MSIPKIIPNPFDQDSSLSELAKKALLIKEGVSLFSLFKEIFALLVIGFLLAVIFKLPILVLTILLGVEFLSTLIIGYISFRKMKALVAIQDQNNTIAYRKILISSEYYKLISAVFKTISNLIGTALIFLFFSAEISNFVAQNINGIFPESLLRGMILIFVVYGLFDFIMRFFRYSLIKHLKESDELAVVNQDYMLIERKLKLIQAIPALGLFALLSMISFKIPVWPILVMLGFVLLVFWLSIVEFGRIKGVNLEDKKIDTTTIQHPIENYQGEQIAGAIFGVMRCVVSFKDVFRVSSSSALGSGKTKCPENTLLVTNCRLLLIQVPMTGGNNVVGEMNYTMQNTLFNRGELRKKGEEILKTNSLTQIRDLALNDILYQDIKSIALKINRVIIRKTDGEKIGYFFFDGEYFEVLKKLLEFYLKDKLIK